MFEQELLKDTPAGGIIEEDVEEVIEEASPEEAETVEELVEEAPESEETELPSASLAELYIKQDLFEEAMTIYRKLLQKEPANQSIKQVLEETKALQAYVEGRE